MNGAIALPFAKTMSAPSKAMMTKIGSSQNFLRARKYWNNSLMNSKIKFLKMK
jgi:hypothetical protein